MFLRVLVGCLLLYSAECLTTAEIAAFNTLRFPDKTETNSGKKTVMTAVENQDGTITLKSNGIPNHATGKFPDASTNPNDLTEQSIEIKFDKSPKMRPAGKYYPCLPVGMIGVAVSGEKIYSPYAAEVGCPTAEEFEELDLCEGHPSPDGSYHVHHFSPCIQKQTCGVASGIIGVAIDGIPIYGPWDENGKQLTRQDLDVCGGKKNSEGQYRYHLTVDPPYFLGCFMAEIRKDVGIPAQLFGCTCPFYDGLFKNNRPPTRSKRQSTVDVPMGCDFTVAGDYANCTLNVDSSYVMTKKWVNETKTIDLAPCCPAGKTCGDSCIELVSGKKVLSANCTREQRAVEYRTRVDKSGNVGLTICMSMMTLLLFLHLL